MGIDIKHHSKESKHLIIFVHGLGGSTESFQNDGKFFFHHYLDSSILQISDIGYYSYHTKLISSKMKSLVSNMFDFFDKEFNNEIDEISDILKTDCINYMSNYHSINFICHSMGGLIVKDLILNKDLTFKNKLFYITLATPHKGSKLANKLIVIKDNHSQIKALKTDSPVLAQLNAEFKYQKNKFHRKYYHAIHDVIVLKENSFSEGEDDLCSTVHGNHVSICKPQNEKEDETLLLNLNQTIIKYLKIGQPSKIETTTKIDVKNNILFDSFNNTNKVFYLNRTIDDTVKNILSVKNIWIYGVSGMGKTSIAQYYFLNTPNAFHHSTYFTNSSEDINEYLQLMYEELIDTIGEDNVDISVNDNINIKLLKTLCFLSKKYNEVIIHLDELSDLGEENFENLFIAFIDILTNQRGSCYLSNVRFIITTIFNPEKYTKVLSTTSYKEKIHSQFDFVKLKKWHTKELTALYNLISKQLNIQINDIHKTMSTFNGKPRALKNKFKNLISSGVYND